jgi:hypothetical protein
MAVGNGRGGWTHPRGTGYSIESDNGKGVVTVRTIHAQLGGSDAERRQMAAAEMVLCGRITAVDSLRRVVTVEQPAPRPEDFVGHRLWQQSGEDIVRHFPANYLGAALQRGKAMAAWMAALAEGPVQRDVIIDEGVEIIIDGTWDHGFDELKVGDRIGVRHRIIQDDGEFIRPDWIRVSR